MSQFNLEVLDPDGALRQAHEDVSGDTRADLFRKAALGAGGLVAGGAMLGALAEGAQAQTRGDVAILNFALTLEFLEAEFYRKAIPNLSGAVQESARVILRHEDVHVQTLRAALRRAAVKKPRFDFGEAVTDLKTFLATAQVLEDTGVAAYAGQGPRLDSKALVSVALSIHSVEARHAAHIRTLRDQPFAPRAFDRALTMRQVLRRVAATGFIKS